MTLKEQWKKIKENWLIALLLIILIALPLLSGTEKLAQTMGISDYGSYFGTEKVAEATMYNAGGSYSRGYYPSPSGNFAPEIKDRKITKNAYLSSEVERGEFKAAEGKLKAILSATDSFLLNENVYQNDDGRSSYYTGSYQLKVETEKYSLIIAQLKEIGEVQSFSEQAEDITGVEQNLNVELEAEKSRLATYQQLLKEAKDINEKITLTDKIFELERTLSYLENDLKDLDRRVDYSTVQVNLQEKPSSYAQIALVKLSELVGQFVGSFNRLLKLLFWLVPWAVAGLVMWLVVKAVRKRK